MFVVMVAVIIIAVVAWIVVGFDWPTMLSVVMLIFLLAIITPWMGRSKAKKEVIIIDDEGLTLNGSIMLGPIPWDCISGASVVRLGLDKTLNIYFTNIPRLEGIFGEKIVRKKVGRILKTGERAISIDLDFLKVKGIDVAALIQMRARGQRQQGGI